MRNVSKRAIAVLKSATSLKRLPESPNVCKRSRTKNFAVWQLRVEIGIAVEARTRPEAMYKIAELRPKRNAVPKTIHKKKTRTTQQNNPRE